MKKLLLIPFFAFVYQAAIYSQVYVDQNAGGNNDGSTWADAYTDLADALNNTTSGQIWVASGTYKPTDCNPCTDTDREFAFTIPPDVQVYGGFVGNETALNQRDWINNEVILSGDIGVQGDSTDNSFRVVIATNSTPNTVFDGFIVEEGNANVSFDFSFGGGIYIDAYDGGTGDIQVGNCTFRNNYATGGGGMAIYCVLGGSSNALIKNCTFEGNTASLEAFSTGAGVILLGNSAAHIAPRFVGCTFRNNYCGNDGGGISATPSGTGTFLGLEVDSCLFENNETIDRGAGIWTRMSSFGETAVVIKNSRFIGNIAGGQGGAIFSRSSFDNSSNDTIINCFFSQNQSTGTSNNNEGEGGAIFLRGSQNGIRNQTIINCAFDRNFASHRGGAIGGTAFFFSEGTLNADVINCSFHGNKALEEGGAVHIKGSTGVSNFNFANCIFWNDSTATDKNEMQIDTAIVSISFSDIEGGLPSGVTDGGNNMEIDPQYANPSAGDLRITGCSPLINAGNNAALPSSVGTDLDGSPRIHEGIVDLGAYEVGIIYVDQNATGLNNGNSWTNAYTDLQDGISRALSGDQVWVAQGTYYPTDCNPCDNTDREAAFYIKPNTEVYGGFNATETALNQRDWDANPTILSADIGISGDSTDNTYRVVIAKDATSKTIFDGFIVEEGNANVSFDFAFGGGMYIDAYDGGTGDIQVRNCTFRNNYATGGGGMAIYCVLGGSSNALIKNCTFEGNTASLEAFSTGAGVIMLGNSAAQITPRFVGCTFRNNYCGNDGGGISATPSGTGTFLGLEVDSCLFENNETIDRGAGIWTRMSSFGEMEVVIKNSRFIGNVAGGQGGAIFSRSSFDNSSNDTIINCFFSQNQSTGTSTNNDGEGGAIFLRGSQNATRNQHIINCIFDQNYAEHRGGAIGSTSFFFSEGILNGKILNCTFYQNSTGGNGGAFHAEGSAGITDLELHNNIFWNNQADSVENELFNNGGNLLLSHNIIEGGIPDSLTDGGNNLDSDPQFLDPTNDDFRISFCSPAREAGTVSVLPNDNIDLDYDSLLSEPIPIDIANQPRVVEDSIDMGAHEWNNDPPALFIEFTKADVSCNGFCDGEATVSAAGGVPGYTFQWSTGESGNTITGLCPGTYQVTISDAFACVLTDSVIIEENPPLTVITSQDTAFCPGESTSLFAVGSGGDSTYTFIWSNGAGQGDSVSVSPVNSTQYTVTITDDSGCSGKDTVSIEVFELPQPQITGSTSFCSGSSTTLDGGAGFSQYLWSDNSTNQTLEVVAPGTYSLTVTDDNGCSATDQIEVEEAEELQPQISGNLSFCADTSTTLDAGVFDSFLWSTGDTTQTIAVNQTNTYAVTVTDADGCSGADTVSVEVFELPQVQITGSTTFCPGSSTTLDGGAGFTQYLWSDNSTNQTLEVVAPATYSLTVTDDNGCSATDQIEVEEAEELQPQIMGVLAFCDGQSTSLSPGNFASYLWSTGDTTNMIITDQPGDYSVTVTENNGCTGEDQVNVIQNENPEPSISGSTTICLGGSTMLDGGGAFEFYLWSDGTTAPILEATEPGIYSLEVTDGNGCIGNDTVEVTISTPPSAFAGADINACPEGTDLSANLPDGAQGLWTTNGSATIFDPNSQITEVAGLDPGINVFIWTLSAPGCPDYSSDSVVVTIPMGPIANDDQYTIPEEGDRILEENILENDQLGDLGTVSLTSLTDPLLGSLEFQPEGNFQYTPFALATGVEAITYEICDADCPDLCAQASVTITIEEALIEEALPNTITPNGDGVNDTFVIDLILNNPDRYPNNELIIFNRWGDIIFQQKNYDNTWGGTNQNGQPLPQGTYYYIFTLDLASGEILRGDLTVLK